MKSTSTPDNNIVTTDDSETLARIWELLETAKDIDTAAETEGSLSVTRNMLESYGTLLVALEIRTLSVQVKRVADELEDYRING